MSTFLLVIGALLMSAAIVAAFRNLTASSVGAYAGLWALSASGYAPYPSSLLIFWAIAVLLVVSITMTRGENLPIPRRARYFVSGGALAGMCAGLIFYQAGAIIGSAVGALLGAIAYSRLAHEADVRKIWKLALTLGLPAVVTMSLLGMGIQGILAWARI